MLRKCETRHPTPNGGKIQGRNMGGWKEDLDTESRNAKVYSERDPDGEHLRQ